MHAHGYVTVLCATHDVPVHTHSYITVLCATHESQFSVPPMMYLYKHFFLYINTNHIEKIRCSFLFGRPVCAVTAFAFLYVQRLWPSVQGDVSLS